MVLVNPWTENNPSVSIKVNQNVRHVKPKYLQTAIRSPKDYKKLIWCGEKVLLCKQQRVDKT